MAQYSHAIQYSVLVHVHVHVHVPTLDTTLHRSCDDPLLYTVHVQGIPKRNVLKGRHLARLLEQQSTALNVSNCCWCRRKGMRQACGCHLLTKAPQLRLGRAAATTHSLMPIIRALPQRPRPSPRSFLSLCSAQ